MSSQTYTVDKTRRLIDLNGDSVNFQVSFRVASKNHEPFDVIVVDQNTLDSNPNLEYKRAEKGEISGNIVQDKNIQQSFYLILKADNPCECVVDINKQELPKKQVELPTLQPQARTAPLPSKTDLGQPKPINWTKVILVLGLIGGAVWLYFWYTKEKKGKDQGKEPAGQEPAKAPANAPKILDSNTVHLPNFRFYTPKNSAGSKQGSPAKPTLQAQPAKKQIENPLLRRLKKLNLT